MRPVIFSSSASRRPRPHSPASDNRHPHRILPPREYLVSCQKTVSMCRCERPTVQHPQTSQSQTCFRPNTIPSPHFPTSPPSHIATLSQSSLAFFKSFTRTGRRRPADSLNGSLVRVDQCDSTMARKCITGNERNTPRDDSQVQTRERKGSGLDASQFRICFK
jgi:hypothetical protein